MKVSVVIPNYKKHPLVDNLSQVLKACPGCEIIVADDASPDDTVKFLKKNFPRVKGVVNQKNLRFAATCNAGAAAASGDVVVLLNSDVAPKKGFLKPLLTHFNKDKKVFAVSCLEIQFALGKKSFSGKNRCWFERGFLNHAAAPIVNFKKPALNCWGTGGSMALDRKKFMDLSGFDTIYAPAYWEDIDLSWRARQQGFRILFEPRSRVFHNHETTNISVFGQKRLSTMAYRNQLIFVWNNIRGRRLVEHFLWLPYHLTITTLRSQGLFLVAFFWAIWRKLTYRPSEKL